MSEIEELSGIREKEVERSIAGIKMGNVILYPTDTIWGLGCDITNASAVKRIYEIKQRPENKPFVLLVSSIEMLKEYIEYIHPRVETLLMHHLQPLTLIYSANDNLPSSLISEDNTVAIRVTHDEFCKGIINRLQQPIIATSANVSDMEFPVSFDDIHIRIKDMADLIVDSRLGHGDKNVPSVIATFNHKGELDFLRT